MESFFGNAKARPAMVSTVTVKKAVQRPFGASTSSSSSRNGHSHSSAGRPKTPLSRDSGRGSHSPTRTSQSHRHSPQRDRERDRDRDRRDHRDRERERAVRDRISLHVKSQNVSSLSPRPSASPRKRKTTSPQRVLPPSDSESESSDDALAPKRRRLPGGIRTAGLGTPDDDLDVGRPVFCPSLADERGEWGRGWAGFVTCEEALRGAVNGWAGGGVKDVKEAVLKERYHAYFPQPGFEIGDKMPSVRLRYPSGAMERFLLVTPSSSREYNPLSELRNALRIILKHYIPPSHTHIFGSLDASGDLESAVPSRLQTPVPGVSTPPPDAASPAPQTPHDTIGDALRRALAPNRRDGPGLLKAVERLNRALAEIHNDGTMAAWLSSPEYRISRRDWSALVDFVHDQSYSRVVAPFSDLLEHHPKHPDDVAAAISEKEDAYGELRHAFMSKVIEQTGLGPDSVFVDLGSGVGNCVVQAAVQAGCKSYGFELLPVPARCARLQVRECQRRWAMWLLQGSLDTEVHEGDFRRHPEVARRLAQADVVLVNNEVFPSSLNIELTNLFLDLKEGATIVSLKPFVPEGFRMNDSNCDSFAAILRSTPHPYHSGWVSWKADSGRYYVQVLDRAMRLKYEEEANSRRRGRS